MPCRSPPLAMKESDSASSNNSDRRPSCKGGPKARQIGSRKDPGSGPQQVPATSSSRPGGPTMKRDERKVALRRGRAANPKVLNRAPVSFSQARHACRLISDEIADDEERDEPPRDSRQRPRLDVVRHLSLPSSAMSCESVESFRRRRRQVERSFHVRAMGGICIFPRCGRSRGTASRGRSSPTGFAPIPQR